VRACAAVVAEATAAGDTRLTHLHSAAPLVLRPTPDALYLAAGAAGPLGGDDLQLSVVVGPGARLVLRTVAATVALPGPGESTLTLRLSVGAGGALAVLPEPTVVAAGARHRVDTLVDVAAGGTLLLREEVLLGRYGEAGGCYRGRLIADAAGTPLLRHELTLSGAAAGLLGGAGSAGGRAVGTLLRVDPRWTRPGRHPDGWAEPDAAAMPLAGPGLLVTALAGDATALRSRLDRALDRPGQELVREAG
jgi:urease accessory protein